MVTPKDFTLPFVKREQVAKDTYAFFFDRTKETFDFYPGQYVRVIIPHPNADQRGTSRFFTIVSSPLEKAYLRIVTKVIQSSFKKSLYNMVPGTSVQFFGPTGTFYLHEEEVRPHILLAGGIGITPFISMLTYIDSRGLTIPVTLFVSFSTIDEIVYKKELEEIAKRNPKVKVVYTVTQPEQTLIPWSGETGRISQELIRKYVDNVLNPVYFIVGPPKMVTAMTEIVTGMGVAEGNICKENFVGY